MKPLPRVALLVTYAVLFFAAAGRSSVQLGTKASEAPVPYSLSAVAAVVYGVIAFALWRGTARWRDVALVGTIVELAGVLTVGTWGIVESGSVAGRDGLVGVRLRVRVGAARPSAARAVGAAAGATPGRIDSNETGPEGTKEQP